METNSEGNCNNEGEYWPLFIKEYMNVIVKILDQFSQSHEMQKEHKFRTALHVTFEKLRRKC